MDMPSFSCDRERDKKGLQTERERERKKPNQSKSRIMRSIQDPQREKNSLPSRATIREYKKGYFPMNWRP